MKLLLARARFSILRRCVSLGLVLAGALSCGSALAAGEAELARRPLGEKMGVQVKFTKGQPPTDLPLLKELGARWVRETVYWAESETKAGVYAGLPAGLRSRLQFYRDNNIGVLLVLYGANPKAYPDTKAVPHRSIDAAAFGRFARDTAAKLKSSGVNFVLEVWNEPHGNNFILRPRLGGNWNGAPDSPWLKHYVSMVNAVVREVKSYDASIPVLASDDMWVLHYWFLEEGLSPDLDGLAVHPYYPQGPEIAAVKHNSDWTAPFVTVDVDRSLSSAVRRLTSQYALKQGKAPQIWFSEWGWMLGQNGPDGKVVTEESLCGIMLRAFVLADDAGAKVLSWFSMRDSVDGQMGLIDNNGVKRKSYWGYKTIAEQLGEFTLVRQVAGTRRRTSGLQGFLYGRDAEHKLVLWQAGKGTTDVKLVGSLAGASAVDVMGQPVETTVGAAGPFLKVGNSPLYLSGMVDSADLNKQLDK